MAVLIQKAMIEIPPRFAGRPPVHPELRNGGPTTWERAQGLAADVEAYGRWMRDEAQRRIGHLYPDATGPSGEKLTPIAWIWARTVLSPDPAWSGHVPLVASWYVSRKKGKPPVWIEPIIDRDDQTISYQIRTGGEPTHERTVSRGNGTCIATGAAIPGDYIKAEGRAGRMGTQLMAVVAEGDNGRVYCPVLATDAVAAAAQQPGWVPHGKNPERLTGGTVFVYGLDEWWKLFTPRQLVALTTFSDLLAEMRQLVESNAREAGMEADGVRLRDGGDGPAAYADAVVTFLAFNASRCADYWCSVCTWNKRNEQVRNAFGRQAIPMTWDFVEANPFSRKMASWDSLIRSLLGAIGECLCPPMSAEGNAVQLDARARVRECAGAVVSTDPPYYDNISYADLSDFFFVWLRRSLCGVWPDECATLATPKAEEMIAHRWRAGSREAADEHFETGMAEFMAEVADAASSEAPATVFYAYKTTENSDGDATGWDTFLQGVVAAGMQVTATWPMRTEMQGRMIAVGNNALASSVVLACRPRLDGATATSRTAFLTALRSELPEAIRLLQSGNIAPVDMAQSAIGPGISIFSRYSEVLYADGKPMPVSDALAIINEVLGEILDGEASELDEDTRFALDWYAQHGFEAGSSGDADNLARAKNAALAGIEQAGIGEARAGKFRLYRRDELPEAWDPQRDDRLTAWEAAQHLVATLEESETHAAGLLHRLGADGDSARQLAYLLYAKADANDWTDEAFAYNMLISAWSDLRSMGETTAGQGALL